MDNFYTILLYVGALLLIGLIKSISGAGKKKPAVAVPRSFSALEEEKQEEIFDYDSIFGFLQENSVSPKIETKISKNKKPSAVLSAQNERDRAMKKSVDTPVPPVEREGSFVFGEFDLPAAIVYSEILKRPNY